MSDVLMPGVALSAPVGDGVVAYTAVLPLRSATVWFVAGLLERLQAELRTRQGRRALTIWQQAVLVCRWFVDGTRVKQLARDNRIGRSTTYRYLDEGLDVLAAVMPSLSGVMLAAKMAGYEHVMIDGTLIPTDRCKMPGPTGGVDLWWSGKHHEHGGNVQVVTMPDGWPAWLSPVRPGREHDTTAARKRPGFLDAIDRWTRDADGSRHGRRHALADLGYQGEAEILTVPFKTPKGCKLTGDKEAYTCCARPCVRPPNAATPCSRRPSRPWTRSR